MENITLVVKMPQPPKPKNKPPTTKLRDEAPKTISGASHTALPVQKLESTMKQKGSCEPNNLGVKLLSAGTAACIADMITFPLDTAKVRLQIQGEGAGRLTGQMYRGVTGTLYTIAKTEGAKAWYSGLSAGLQRQMCFASIRIGLYDSMKQFYVKTFSVSESGSGMFGVRVLAGLTTGGLAVVAAQPTDVVKVRLQAQGGLKKNRRYKGLRHAYSSIAMNEGVRGLWKGALPNIARNSIVNVTELVSYDLIKEFFLARRILADGIPCHVSSAFGAGLITTMIASPVDVVKTRFMNSSPGTYTGALNCAAKMLRSEGLPAFYKGCMPSFMRLGSWNVVMFVTYEQIKRLTCNTDNDALFVTHYVINSNQNNNNVIAFAKNFNSQFYKELNYNVSRVY